MPQLAVDPYSETTITVSGYPPVRALATTTPVTGLPCIVMKTDTSSAELSQYVVPVHGIVLSDSLKLDALIGERTPFLQNGAAKPTIEITLTNRRGATLTPWRACAQCGWKNVRRGDRLCAHCQAQRKRCARCRRFFASRALQRLTLGHSGFCTECVDAAAKLCIERHGRLPVRSREFLCLGCMAIRQRKTELPRDRGQRRLRCRACRRSQVAHAEARYQAKKKRSGSVRRQRKRRTS